jgi:hypothetical protein
VTNQRAMNAGGGSFFFFMWVIFVVVHFIFYVEVCTCNPMRDVEMLSIGYGKASIARQPVARL